MPIPAGYHTKAQLLDLTVEAADNLRTAIKRNDPNNIAIWLGQMREYLAMVTIAEGHEDIFYGTAWNNAGSLIADPNP